MMELTLATVLLRLLHRRWKRWQWEKNPTLPYKLFQRYVYLPPSEEMLSKYQIMK